MRNIVVGTSGIIEFRVDAIRNANIAFVLCKGSLSNNRDD